MNFGNTQFAIYAILSMIAFAHFFAATIASVVVIRDKSLDRIQVISKLMASWIVIYVGPLFVLYLMNDHSPELVPRFVQKGFLHTLFFAPIKPPPHNDNPWGFD